MVSGSWWWRKPQRLIMLTCPARPCRPEPLYQIRYNGPRSLPGVAMFGLFSKPSSRIERFFERFGRRTVIVHRGFDPEWLEQLLKLPGGAGHFRVDARRAPGRRP